MKVTVKTMKGEIFEVEAEGADKVQELKKKIEAAKSDLPADQLKLIHAGKILKDADSIEETGYKPGGFLVVMVNKAKAPDAAAAAPAPAAAATAAASAPATALAGATDDTPVNLDRASAELVTGSAMEATIQQLCDMGFDRPQVMRCLGAAFNNPDRAYDYLTNGIPASLGEDQEAPPAPGSGGGAGGAPPVPAEGGGGGGLAFPAMGAPSPYVTGIGGEVDDPDAAAAIAELRNHPRFAELAQMVAQNPAMLQQILPVLAQSNPQLVQVIAQNPQAFLAALSYAAADGGGGPMDPMQAMMAGAGGGGLPPGTQVVQLSQAEQEAVQRLEALGFDRQAAVQAYLACEKNVELAANFLFQSGLTDD